MKLAVAHDVKQRTVSIGDVVIDQPTIINNTTWPMIRAKVAFAYQLENSDQGVGPDLRRAITTACKKVWIEPYKEDILTACQDTSSGLIDVEKLSAFWDRLADIESTKELHVENLQPWIVAYKKSPTELRQQFGKANWRSLRELTSEESEAAVRLIESLKLDLSDVQAIVDLVKAKDVWPTIDAVANAVAKQCEAFDLARFFFLRRVYDYLAQDESSSYAQRGPEAYIQNEWINLTEAFAANEYLQENFDILKLTPKRYIEVQEMLVRRHQRELSLKHHASKFYGWESAPQVVECSLGRAELVATPKKLMEEGEYMKHCIGAYVNRVEQGDYLVYHIKTGDEHFTLGLSASKFVVQGQNQLKGKQNREPSRDAKTIADLVVTTIEQRSAVDRAMSASDKNHKLSAPGEALGSRMASFLHAEGIVQEGAAASDADETPNLGVNEAQLAAFRHHLRQ